MTDHNADQLREAFRAHEELTPDPAEVYARVQDLSRTYKRRRRGAQLAGGAVLGAGIIVGAFQVPALFASAPTNQVTMVAPADAPSSAPAASPTPSAAPNWDSPEYDDEFDAYFGAGYGLTEAEELARLWKMDDLSGVKVEAGRRILAGVELPVQPDPASVVDAEEQKKVDAFFDAGYTYDDAVELKDIWKTEYPYDAKVIGGGKILAGEEMPFAP